MGVSSDIEWSERDGGDSSIPDPTIGEMGIWDRGVLTDFRIKM